ncbi:hypothetical protein DFH11DRAFT_1612082, partial [Phellopilus nigrolimitatus]
MVPHEHNGVVDSKLRVYGTKNVRVVDLSIVPLTVAAHIHQRVCDRPASRGYFQGRAFDV